MHIKRQCIPLSLYPHVSLDQEIPCPLARNREDVNAASLLECYSILPHVSSLVTTVSHPLGPIFTLIPTHGWTPIKPDLAKEIAAPVPWCVYKLVWILYLIPKCEPTFALWHSSLITALSTKALNLRTRARGGYHGCWWSVWEHSPCGGIQNPQNAPMTVSWWSTQLSGWSCARTPCLAPPALPSQAEPCTLGLTSGKNLPLHTNNPLWGWKMLSNRRPWCGTLVPKDFQKVKGRKVDYCWYFNGSALMP